jgi:predicted nucleic acid-binding protein
VSTHPHGRVLAVLETSFWVVAYRAEVAANCLDLFEIVVPRAVEAEILGTQPGVSVREYPYATLFRHLREKLKTLEAEVLPLTSFGPGEAAAIPLAAHLNAVLLINERPGAQYARNIGIDVATVPSIIVLLRARGVIGDRAARRKLALIANNTAPVIMQDALRVLDALSSLD